MANRFSAAGLMASCRSKDWRRIWTWPQPQWQVTIFWPGPVEHHWFKMQLFGLRYLVKRRVKIWLPHAWLAGFVFVNILFMLFLLRMPYKWPSDKINRTLWKRCFSLCTAGNEDKSKTELHKHSEPNTFAGDQKGQQLIQSLFRDVIVCSRNNR